MNKRKVRAKLVKAEVTLESLGIYRKADGRYVVTIAVDTTEENLAAACMKVVAFERWSREDEKPKTSKAKA